MQLPSDDHPPLRVLVVDDNMDAADGLAAVLEVLGCDVATAYDGPQGIAAAAAVKPHLAFIDLEMPGMNGREVVRRLHPLASAGKMRLVCLTGRGSDQDRKLCLEAGFDDFVTKPISPEALDEYVERLRSEL